jgi:hypothetical protein
MLVGLVVRDSEGWPLLHCNGAGAAWLLPSLVCLVQTYESEVEVDMANPISCFG